MSAGLLGIESFQFFNDFHVPFTLMVPDVAHPAEESLTVNLVNGEVVLFEKLIKFQAHNSTST